MNYFCIIFFTLIVRSFQPDVSSAVTETFYLTASGKGTKNGSSLGNAFSPRQFNDPLNWSNNDGVDGKIGPGDIILVFDDDGDFRPYRLSKYTLELQGSGLPNKFIELRAADGERPVFDSSTVLSTVEDWKEESPNIWYAELDLQFDCKLALFGDPVQENAGKRQKEKAHLKESKHFYNDVDKRRIYVYSVGNPMVVYGQILLPGAINSILGRNVNYIKIEGLTLRYSASSAIRGSNVSHWYINNNEVSWIGGQASKNAFVGNGILIDGASRYFWISGNSIFQVYDAGITIQAFAGETIEEAHLFDNKITRSGAGIEFDAIGLPGGVARNGWIHGNAITDSGFGWSGVENSLFGKGIAVGVHKGCQVDKVAIYDNNVDGFANSGISVRGAGGTVNIYQNRITNGRAAYTNVSYAAIVLHGIEPLNNQYDITAKIYQNVIFHNDTHAIDVVNNSSKIYIYENTIYNKSSQYSSIINTYSSSGVIANNIIYNESAPCFKELSKLDSGFFLDHNIYYRNDKGPIIDKGGLLFNDLDSWRKASKQDNNSMQQDPLLANPVDADFRLHGNSPALGKGFAVSFTKFPEEWSLDQTRPIDIGAYQVPRVLFKNIEVKK